MTTSFSDALTTIDPNNTNGIGANWMQGTKADFSDQPNVNGCASRIKVATKDGVNALCWEAFPTSSSIAPLNLLRGFAFPIPLYTDTRGLTQFCQCTNVKQSIGADGSGLTGGVMTQFQTSTRRLNTYVLLAINTGSWLLLRFNDSSPTVLASGAGQADGDIWKINSDTSNPAQVVVKGFRNGSQIANVTDTSGSRLSHGIPALYCQFDTQLSVTATSEWRTFSAGTGL